MPEEQGYFTGLFDKGGAFDRLVGYGLEYERIQHGYDASGQSQQVITKVPQKDSQAIANTAEPAMPQSNVKQYAMYGVVGVLGLVAVFALARK